ncbi:MAG: hypothetical protein IRZ03_08320 [Acidobacterium ailaaui]|nr:hypothetical protein [Pseudacidobacterium ailaaui]
MRLTQEPYGFTWGPITVTRAMEINGSVALWVSTLAEQKVEIYSSPAGKSLRVFRDGKELFPREDSENE